MLCPSIFVTPALFSLHPVAACAPWLFKTPGLASNLQGIAEERPSPCCNENPDLPEAAQMQKNIQNPLTPVSTLLRFRYSMPEAAPQRCPGRCWRARAFSKATERTHSLRQPACNENSGGVTKMLFRSKNVKKCNEISKSLAREHFSLHFVY